MALKATAMHYSRAVQQKFQHEPNCTLGDLNTEEMATTDIFMRSYHGDLKWLDNSVPSITESMQCRLWVIRNVLVVVPEDDVTASNEKLNAV